MNSSASITLAEAKRLFTKTDYKAVKRNYKASLSCLLVQDIGGTVPWVLHGAGLGSDSLRPREDEFIVEIIE